MMLYFSQTSCFNAIIVLGFICLSITIITNTSATFINNVQTAKAATLPCSHPQAMEAAHTFTLGYVVSRSAIHCITQCLRHNMCTAAARVKRNDATSASCFLLGGISQKMTTVIENLSEEKCTMHVLNRCPAESTQYRSNCKCPPGKTGQFCQLTNPEDCSSSWSRVYISNGTGDKDTIINANKDNLGGYNKIALNQSDGSLLILHGKLFVSSGDVFASQMAPTLSRKSWDEFEDIPVQEYRFVGSNGSVQSFTETSNAKMNSMMTSEWFMRQPHVTGLLYAYDTSGQAINGTVDNVIQAVKSGQDILSYNAVHVQQGVNKVQLSRYHWEISLLFSQTYIFHSVSYWINEKRTTDGTYTTHRVYIVSDEHKTIQYTSRGGKLYVDVCWTQAYQDPFSDNNNNKNVGHLVSAVLNGHAVRVAVDDLALTVDHVVINTDTVVFGTRPFLDPVGQGSFTASSQSVRVVATTDGVKFTCQANPSAGSVVLSTTSSASVTWFVDTRQRSRVYSVTSEGIVTHGTEAELYVGLRKGASLTVGVTFSQPSHYLLLLVSAVELTATGHVVAMAEDLSRLPIPKGQVMSPLECGLRALLVTSLGLVRTYEYKHREAGTHGVLNNVTLDWFLDSYDDH